MMKILIRNPISRILDIVTNHSHASQSHVTDIDHSKAISILSSERRRHTIEYLADQPPNVAVPVSDIAEGVAAMEHDCTVEELSPQQRKRVYISLHQQHIPILEESVISYNQDRQQVTPTQTPAQIWRAFTAFEHTLDG